MKKVTKNFIVLMASLLLINLATMAQTKKAVMKTYVIERNIPGAGQFSQQKLKDISKISCKVLKEMGPQIQWVHSYVTGDKIFCVYKAENVELLKEHAKKGGFPINNVYEVDNVISPATAKN